MTATAALVLAGGRGERLGSVNKALLQIGGLTMLERLRKAVAGCNPCLVAIGHGLFPTPGFVQVRDLHTDYAGPLAGLAAGIDALVTFGVTHLLSVAVDTPFFPHDFAARAQVLIGTRDVVLSAYGPQDYPTNALWRLDAVRDLPHRLHEGTAPHSLKRLAESLVSVRLDYAPLAAEDPFANVNTPDDLAALTARAAREIPG